MIFGVNWFNTNNNRIDLDISLVSAEIGKIGWDASYRSEDRGILFSGMERYNVIKRIQELYEDRENKKTYDQIGDIIKEKYGVPVSRGFVYTALKTSLEEELIRAQLFEKQECKPNLPIDKWM